MASVLLAFGTADLQPPEWIIGALGGAASFCVVLTLSGEVSPSEWRRLIAAVRAGRGSA
jgi:hypothetical protein